MKKIRLGFYMYTPMLGGAEAHLKDLLWNVDRGRFDVTFYYEAWPDFVAFLELDKCPSIHLRPVNVIEPCGHTQVTNREGPSADGQAKRNGHASLKSKLRPLYKRTPFGPLIATHGLKWLNYSMWAVNKRRLRAALSEQPVDILHIVNGGYPGATTARIAAVVARELGIPCVMTICSTAAAADFPQLIEHRLDRLVFESVDTFVIPADLLGQALVDHRNFGSSKFHKIYFGVKAPEPRIDQKDLGRATRAKLGIPPEALVIGTVSSFTPSKGQAHLIDALSLLRPRVPNLRAVLVGDGPTHSEVKKRAETMGVDDITIFTGFYEDVFAAIGAFDVFVLPSELEGLPYVVLEAMSQRKPVVATEVGGIPEAIISGDTGLLVPPGDPAVLAEAIGSILNNRRLAERMSDRAYDHFKQNFTVERMVQQHELLYQEMAESKQPIVVAD